MGWWKRMRNKFKKKKTARPVRYGGHGDPFADPTTTTANPAPPRTPPRTPPEKAMIEEGRFSLSALRPSMGSGTFEQMSFELPRR